MESSASTGIKQFSGCDFADFKFRIECLFDEKQLIQFLNNEPNQLDEVDQETHRLQRVAKNLLVKHVAASHMSFIKGKPSVYHMWRNLVNTFEPRTLGKRVMIKRKLNTIRCESHESLEMFLRRYDALVEDFRTAGGVIEDNELVTSLLATLPEKYDNIVTVLETMDDLFYDRAKALLLEREMKLNEKSGHENETPITTAFSTNKGKNSRRKPTKSKKKPNTCWTCGEPNHKSPDCPQKKKE